MLHKEEFGTMLKKIYLFIIPCCLIISKADACGGLRGHIVFHNNTSMHLDIKLKRVGPSDYYYITTPNYLLRESDRYRHLKMRRFYSHVHIAPKKKSKGICWIDKGFGLEDFEVSYKYHGRSHAGPKGVGHKFHYNLTNFSAHFEHGGDQTLIKSSGCQHNKLLQTCSVKFDMSKKR